MTTTLQSNKLSPVAAQPKFLPAGAIVVQGSVVVANAPSVGDKWDLCQIPAGASISELALGLGLDTNGTPTLKVSVGDSTSAAALISGAAQPAGGGVLRTTQPGGVGYTPGAVDTLAVSVTSGAATFASGSVNFAVTYTMDP